VDGGAVRSFLERHRAELRLVARALIAALLSQAIGMALALPQTYWAVITSLLVIQGSIGGTLGAGVDRLNATLAGAVLGAAAAFLREKLAVPEVLALVAALAPLSFLAALRPGLRVAPVTAAIVLLATPSNASPLTSALHRVGEITLGTAVGILVSLFVFPSRARRLCIERAADLLLTLSQLLSSHLRPPDAAKGKTIERLNGQVRAALRQLTTAVDEARRERVMQPGDDPVPERLLRVLRRLRVDVAFVGRATGGAADALDWPALAPPLEAIATTFEAAAGALSASLREGMKTPDLSALDEAAARLQAMLDEKSGIAASPRSAVLPFIIGALRRDLGDLVDTLAPRETS
jgi:uncharacterized membrane protein YccC